MKDISSTPKKQSLSVAESDGYFSDSKVDILHLQMNCREQRNVANGISIELFVALEQKMEMFKI